MQCREAFSTYLESQEAQHDRLLDPKLAHNSGTVASYCRPLAFQVVPAGSVLLSQDLGIC